MRASRLPAILLGLAACLPGSLLGQRAGYSYLAYVGSEVSLVSGAEDDTTARPNTPILVGDRLVTGPSSRAEAILADGNVVRVDVRSSLRFDRLARTYESEDERNALLLERGSIVLEHLWDTTLAEATRIDTDDVTVLVPDRGLVRIDAGRRGTEVYVVGGRAELHARAGRAVLRAGEYAWVSGGEEIEIDAVDPPRDRFTRFVEERQERSRASAGNRYVDGEYAYDYAVADFDSSGSWVFVASTGGYCWRPVVASDWRPYTSGYWRWSPAGLTWVPYEPWGWLTFHYGSWLWDVGLGWCWAPGSVYSPAWVYWAYTPSWVGWCPIGYYGWYQPWHGSYAGGSHGGGRHPYPHLHGPAEVGRFDRRAWTYLPVSRMGTRFDARRDLASADRVGFRPGERGWVATTPLRIERGTGGTQGAIQEALRRAPRELETSARGGRDEALTQILRREAVLSPAARGELDRSSVRAGSDPFYRPVPVDRLASDPSRESSVSRGSSGRGGPGAPSVPGPSGATSREAWRGAGTPPPASPGRTSAGEGTPSRRDAEVAPSRERTVRGDDGWRAPASTPPEAPARRETGAPTRATTPVSGAPRTEPPPRTERRDAPPPVEASPRSGGRETPSPRSAEPPARAPEVYTPRSAAPPARPAESSPAAPPSGSRESAPPRPEPPAPRAPESPAPRGETAWRSVGGRESAPRTYESPSRSYSAPVPRYESPQTRSYGAPAPRTEAPQARTYGSPAARYEAPPSRSSSAPAPRYEAPPARSSSAPAPRYEAPSGSRGAAVAVPAPSAPSTGSGGREGKGRG